MAMVSREKTRRVKGRKFGRMEDKTTKLADRLENGARVPQLQRISASIFSIFGLIFCLAMDFVSASVFKLSRTRVDESDRI